MEHKTDLTLINKKKYKLLLLISSIWKKYFLNRENLAIKRPLQKPFEKYDEDGNKNSSTKSRGVYPFCGRIRQNRSKKCFAKIADEANFNHKQMQFVKPNYRLFLRENGVVEIKQLMEYPF